MADVSGKEPLTFHAAKKTLIDFFRTIAIDSFALPLIAAKQEAPTTPVLCPSSTPVRTRPATPSTAMNRSQAGTTSSSCWADVWISTQYHLAGLKEQMEVERRQRQQAVQPAQLGQSGRDGTDPMEETELVRGLWGLSEVSRVLTKWMLDTTEGPCRMRKKLTPNPNFYALYPFRPELELAENKSLRYKVAVSLDAKEHFHLFVSNNWRRSLFPSVQQQTVAVSLVAPSVEGGQQDRLDTAITQLDLPQLLRPNKKEPSMADIDEDAELLMASTGTDNGCTATIDKQLNESCRLKFHETTNFRFVMDNETPCT